MTASQSSPAGRSWPTGTPAELKRRVSQGNVLEVETFGLPPGVVDGLRSLTGVRTVVVEERGPAQVLLVHAEPGHELTQPVLGRLDGARIGRVATRQPTLEDAYIELVGARERTCGWWPLPGGCR